MEEETDDRFCGDQPPDLTAQDGSRYDVLGLEGGGEDKEEKFEAEVRRAFELVDFASVGRLTPQDMATFWPQLLPGITASQLEELQEVFPAIDLDNDGLVTVDELLFFLDPTHNLYNTFNIDPSDLELMNLAGTANWKLDPPKTARETIWALLNVQEAGKYLNSSESLQRGAFVVQIISQLAICASIINMMIESEPSVQIRSEEEGRAAPTFVVETITIALFTIEFVLRFATTPSQEQFWREWYTWIDLLAILPYYMMEIGLANEWAKGLVVLRVVRLTKLLRILKVGRHSVGFHLLTLSVQKALLPLLWLLFVLVLAMVLFSALIYFAETSSAATLDAERGIWRRDADSKYADAGQIIQFESVHASLWWAITTLTTTGYGDLVPKTEIGKAVGGLAMLCGVLLLAFPTTILTQQFSKVFMEHEERRKGEVHKAVVRRKLVSGKKAINRMIKAAEAEERNARIRSEFGEKSQEPGRPMEVMSAGSPVRRPSAPVNPQMIRAASMSVFRGVCPGKRESAVSLVRGRTARTSPRSNAVTSPTVSRFRNVTFGRDDDPLQGLVPASASYPPPESPRIRSSELRRDSVSTTCTATPLANGTTGLKAREADIVHLLTVNRLQEHQIRLLQTEVKTMKEQHDALARTTATEMAELKEISRSAVSVLASIEKLVCCFPV
ncbi:Potassium voltage-gated channel protein Shab [Diplonema papillatum]|nr:Potassium voltage-gated channel protein Shab [Diplonema papillatum]